MKSLSKEFIRRKDPKKRVILAELKRGQLEAATGGIVIESEKGLKEKYRNSLQVGVLARSRR